MIASTWVLATFKDLDLLTFGNDNIVSTWDLVNSEGYGGWVKDDFMFINLGSGGLRGLVCRADHSLGHCINLESGHLQGRTLVGDEIGFDYINLESGHLRRQISTEALKHRNCINLRFGHLRGLQGQDHVGVVDCINLGAAKTRTSPTPTAQANDTAFPSSIKSTFCKQVFYPVHFRSSKGYNFFIRNTPRERSPHVRRQVGGTPEHPRR